MFVPERPGKGGDHDKKWQRIPRERHTQKLIILHRHELLGINMSSLAAWEKESKGGGERKEVYYIHSSSSWMHARRYPPQSTLPNSRCVWKRRFSIDTKESENRNKRVEYIQREWREKEKETRERTKQETSRNSLPASILLHSCCHCELQGDQNP